MLKRYFSIIVFLLLSFSLKAQIEKVIVETYYVSDSLDATNTTGDTLPKGSKTYRVYIDLKPGSKLRKIYGDPNHPLKFSSTANFFNNRSEGQVFAKNFSKNSYGRNTVALDSWLTLGQTTITSDTTYFGVLKSQDKDGSFVGGANNDGGSQSVTGGLLKNNDPLSGIPLTTADGMDTMVVVPGSWSDYGFQTPNIFGTLLGSQFISYYAGLQNSGVTGVDPDSNQVLVAQLTTKGDISFELNLEVEEFDGVNSRIVKYVADDKKLQPNETYNSILKYPPVCGCKDPRYLEYKASYGCNQQEDCKTLIVYGCADPMACNYNPNANFNLQELCCYPGYCNDRDINIVCPNLSVKEINKEFNFDIYPNPTLKYLTLKINSPVNGNFNYDIYDQLGEIVLKEAAIEKENKQIDVSGFPAGLYLLRLSVNGNYSSRIFIKN